MKSDRKDIVDETAAVVERLRAAYTSWNNPPSDGLPEGAEVVLEAADLLERLSRERGTVQEGWQDISTAPHGKKVIVRARGDFQGERTMMARFYPKYTLEAPDGYGASDGFDEDEHGDVYAPEGWYEDMEAEEPPLHNIDPTHWMPLPAPPGSASPVPQNGEG